MNNASRKKSDQLGMDFGTACHRLRTAVMFALARKLGLATCFRCGLEIATPDDLSMDHVRDWLDVDPKLFWDTDNIAFSHKRCNRPAKVGAGFAVRIVPPEGKGWCSGCAAFKDRIEFPSSKRTWNGIARHCYECRKKAPSYRSRSWRVPGLDSHTAPKAAAP